MYLIATEGSIRSCSFIHSREAAMGRMGSVAWGGVGACGFLVVSACGSDPVQPTPTVLTEAAWEWRSACCGVAGTSLTPATEGFDYRLRFREDGTVQARRGGSVVLETTYRVRTTSPIDFEDELTVVTYGDPLPLGPGIEPVSRQMLIHLEGGRLLLRNLDGCADCFGDWEFTRASG